MSKSDEKKKNDEKIEWLDEGRLLTILDEAVTEKGLKILDGSRDEFIVKNPGEGNDLQVIVNEVYP